MKKQEKPECAYLERGNILFIPNSEFVENPSEKARESYLLAILFRHRLFPLGVINDVYAIVLVPTPHKNLSVAKAKSETRRRLEQLQANTDRRPPRQMERRESTLESLPSRKIWQ
jgi:hypothetical protein